MRLSEAQPLPGHPQPDPLAGLVDVVALQDHTDAALAELEKHDPFFSFWLPMVRASVLGNLGRVDEARTHLHLVREQKPDFAPRARELLCRSLKIDAVVDGLRTAGVSHAFGLPGTQNLALFEALRSSPLRTVVPSHELGASFMAGGYARAGGKVPLLVTIPGPGFTYALTGLAEARLDSAPLVHLTAAPATAAPITATRLPGVARVRGPEAAPPYDRDANPTLPRRPKQGVGDLFRKEKYPWQLTHSGSRRPPAWAD